VGGGGEKKTLRIVAKHANKSNFSGSPDVVKHKINVLKKHCDYVGRDINSIIKTTNGLVVIAPTRVEYLIKMKERYKKMGMPGSFNEWMKGAENFYIAGTPEDCIKRINQYINLGVQSFILKFGDVPNTKDMELFAEEVIPKIN
jgi:alkanesulfonate monooxygenase SsuD/methylene tetrahydromethanopterin reductase-like flavin-dependent oxidoreductase (luciferase family)